MKHSNTQSSENTPSKVAAWLMWLLPILLIVPNIALDFTEIAYTPLQKAINIILPLGIYYVICAIWRKIGVTTLLMLPVMMFAAFQIVLLFLYGESIIAIDMFLNVATTSVSEAGELLANLGTAILVVVLLYAPAIIVAILLIAKGRVVPDGERRVTLYSGIAITIVGAICMSVAFASPEGYRPTRRLFPANVASNMVSAFMRTKDTANYHANAADFKFGAVSTHTDSLPEIYVLVVGETSRAGNWQLNGYERETNPKLSHRSGLVSCKKALSESNTTHKSVPLMLSHLTAEEFVDSIYSSKGIIEAFNEAGFSTAWLSNQQRNHSLIDFFGSEASDVCFMKDDGENHYDCELCDRLKTFIQRPTSKKCFVVLHTYGSHFNYRERYPDGYSYFTPDDASAASIDNRSNLLNAYDNSIRYTDAMLDSVISTVANTGVRAAVVYAADHGEDIYDDSRERFLHASPTPTYWQIHVPMLMWMSDTYRNAYPEKYDAVVANSGKNISTSRSAFHTMLSLAGVSAPCYSKEAAVCEPSYTEPARVYLNDYDEAVELGCSGLRDSDFKSLASVRISI